MITEPIFSEIVIRHMKAILDEVKENDGASAYQWNHQMSNMVVSTLMTLTDNMDGPREDLMTHLVADLFKKIMEQVKFQLKYDGVSIEDVKKDLNKNLEIQNKEIKDLTERIEKLEQQLKK